MLRHRTRILPIDSLTLMWRLDDDNVIPMDEQTGKLLQPIACLQRVYIPGTTFYSFFDFEQIALQ